MSGSSGMALAPSPALLRYLRHQIQTAPISQSIKPCRRKPHLFSTSRPSSQSVIPQCTLQQQRQRAYTTTSCRSSSHLDEIFARNRQKCLPAPRQPIRSSRFISSDTYRRPSFFQRVFHRHKEHGPPPTPPASYEETSAQLFNLSRTLSHKGTELKLRCTEFDSNGSVTLVSGEFKKSELIAKYGLLPRDLRKIDSSVLPHILVRPTAILINLLHLRVLIQSDRVLVFDAYGSTDSYTQSLFMYDLEGKLRQKTQSDSNLPYEFRALEAVLISVTSGLEAEFALVREPVTHILRALEEDIDREKLRHLLIHSKKLGTFEQKARLVRDALDELLEADDDLASMYLSERKQGKLREEENHTEVEMLLESYHKICDEVVEISGNLISNIRNTEEVVKAILDANRNQLMLFEIKVSIATLGLAGGTLIAGFYGMNLENFIEETNWGFGAVTFTCVAFSVWTCVYGLKRLRKVQKVRMWNEPTSTSDWRRVRKETMEQLAMGEEKKRKLHARAAAPVLWPGMHGLYRDEDTNSDADDVRGTRVRDETGRK